MIWKLICLIESADALKILIENIKEWNNLKPKGRKHRPSIVILLAAMRETEMREPVAHYASVPQSTDTINFRIKNSEDNSSWEVILLAFGFIHRCAMFCTYLVCIQQKNDSRSSLTTNRPENVIYYAQSFADWRRRVLDSASIENACESTVEQDLFFFPRLVSYLLNKLFNTGEGKVQAPK